MRESVLADLLVELTRLLNTDKSAAVIESDSLQPGDEFIDGHGRRVKIIRDIR